MTPRPPLDPPAGSSVGGSRVTGPGGLARGVAWLALLTGCAVAPPPRPELAVTPPAQWTAAAPEAARAEPLSTDAALRWWSSFGDPRLDALVEQALAENRDLAAAGARVAAAAAAAAAVGADLRPQAAFGLDAARQRRSFVGFPIPGSDRQVLSTTTTTFTSALNVSWEADLWGRLRAGEAAALAGLEATEAELDAARLSLAARTAGAWFAVVESRRQLELAEATLENRRLNQEQVERRYRAGVRGPLDLRLARAGEADATALVARRRRQLDAAARGLDLLLSRYPAGAERAGGADLPDPPAAAPAGLPAELLVRRPDLLAAERRLSAAGLEVARARAALFPALRLTGSAGRLSQDVEDLLDRDFSIWSLLGGLLQPVFQGGRLRANVELQRARFEEAAESYAQRVLTAFAEVESALAAEDLLAEEERALADAAREAAAAQSLAEDRYRRGVGEYLNVLEARRQALDSASRHLAVRRARLDARIDLHLALGGGFTTENPPAARPPESDRSDTR